MSKVKSPTVFARLECATMGTGDVCQSSMSACLLTLGEPCLYFETSVLPLADAKPQYEKAAAAYRELHDLVEKKVRGCPDCGAPLGPRMRLCKDCKRKHRQATWRASRQKTEKGQGSATLPRTGPSEGVDNA